MPLLKIFSIFFIIWEIGYCSNLILEHADELKFKGTPSYFQMLARGEVILAFPAEDMDIKAQELVLNYHFGTTTLIVKELKGVLKKRWYIKSKKGIFYGTDNISLYSAEITTCSRKIPHYRVSASSFKLTHLKNLYMRGIKLRLLNIPIFYLPFLYYDLSSRNLWHFSVNSTRKGNIILTPAFQIHNPETDFNLGLYFILKKGIGLKSKYQTTNYTVDIFLFYPNVVENNLNLSLPINLFLPLHIYGDIHWYHPSYNSLFFIYPHDHTPLKREKVELSVNMTLPLTQDLAITYIYLPDKANNSATLKEEIFFSYNKGYLSLLESNLLSCGYSINGKLREKKVELNPSLYLSSPPILLASHLKITKTKLSKWKEKVTWEPKISLFFPILKKRWYFKASSSPLSQEKYSLTSSLQSKCCYMKGDMYLTKEEKIFFSTKSELSLFNKYLLKSEIYPNRWGVSIESIITPNLKISYEYKKENYLYSLSLPLKISNLKIISEVGKTKNLEKLNLTGDYLLHCFYITGSLNYVRFKEDKDLFNFKIGLKL